MREFMVEFKFGLLGLAIVFVPVVIFFDEIEATVQARL